MLLFSHEITPNRSALTQAEYHDLIKKNILFGLIPLKFKEDDFLDLQQKAQSFFDYSRSGNNLITNEMSRLCSERSYLLDKIQQMSQSYVSHCENVKSYFEEQITTSNLREGNLQRQIDELKTTLKLSESQLQIVEELNLKQLEEFQKYKSDMQMKITEYEKDIELRLHGDAEKFEKELEMERSKSTRLIAEYSVLQREVGKKDVVIKTLQRDTMKIQTSLELKMKEVESLKSQQLNSIALDKETILRQQEKISSQVQVIQELENKVNEANQRMKELEEEIRITSTSKVESSSTKDHDRKEEDEVDALIANLVRLQSALPTTVQPMSFGTAPIPNKIDMTFDDIHQQLNILLQTASSTKNDMQIGKS